MDLFLRQTKRCLESEEQELTDFIVHTYKELLNKLLVNSNQGMAVQTLTTLMQRAFE